MPRKKSTDKISSAMPEFIQGVQAGYSYKNRRWKARDGHFTTKASALAQNGIDNDPGKMGGMVFPTPVSSRFEMVEVAMSGIGNAVPKAGQPFRGLSNILQAALDVAKDPNSMPIPNYMPIQMQTRMNLARYFYNTDGDAYNICAIPIELLSRKVDVQCPDKGLRKEIEDWKTDKRLDELGGELWRSMRIFGQSYPWECWSDDGKELQDVVPLAPINVHVGYNWTYTLSAEVAGQATWNEALVKSVFPPAMYRSLMRHWNDNPLDVTGKYAYGMTLSGDNLKPITDGALRWERYSMPMLSRAFRDFTTRIVYEDAVRAIIEGYRAQFWVVKLGDAEHPPLPEEINALKNVLAGMAGERTGLLVWRNTPLEVEIHVPKGLDEAVGNEFSGSITKNIFRRMGITSTVVSGEIPGKLGVAGGAGGSGASDSIDVQIYLERARYQAEQVTNWMLYLVKKQFGMSGAAKKALARTHLSYGPTTFEMENRVKNIFLPTYSAGALSFRTLMDNLSLDSDVELSNKREEKSDKDAGLLDPPVAFKEKVENSDGSESTTSQTKPKGSPGASEEIRNKLTRGKQVKETQDAEPE